MSDLLVCKNFRKSSNSVGVIYTSTSNSGIILCKDIGCNSKKEGEDVIQRLRSRNYCPLLHPIPAGIFWKPETPNMNTHAVNTKGPVRAGKPHIPKNLCRAGITITEHAIVANTA